MTKARVDLDKKTLAEHQKILIDLSDKNVVDMSYAIVKNLYHENHVRIPICQQLDKKLTGPIADSRAFRALYNLEEPWELIGNANDAGANKVSIWVHAFQRSVVCAFIDDGKGFDHFFALNKALSRVKKASKTGFVAFDTIKNLRYIIDQTGSKSILQFNNRKLFEKKKQQATAIAGARGLSTECLSDFLGPGNLLIGNVDDLRSSPQYQKMVGLSQDEAALLPKTGAVVIMRSVVFSKEAYLTFLKTKPQVLMGTIEGRYQDYLFDKYPELSMVDAPLSPLPTKITLIRKRPPAIQAKHIVPAQSPSLVTTQLPNTSTGPQQFHNRRFTTFSSFSPLPVPQPTTKGVSDKLPAGKKEAIKKQDSAPSPQSLAPKTS